MVKSFEDKFNTIYNEKNDVWGYPQVWKDTSFYPIKIKDAKALKLFYKIFQYPKYPKQFVDQKLVIKSSYLKYLLIFIEGLCRQSSDKPAGGEIHDGLIEFLKIVTRSENVRIEKKLVVPKEQKNPDYHWIIQQTVFTVFINGVGFSETDFDFIREIILRQNGLSTKYIDEFNPDLENALQQANSKFMKIDFEDEIILFSVLMGIGLHDVENYTLYQFRRSMDRLLMVHHFNLFKPLETSGQIKAKNGKELIPHYFTPIDKNQSRYSSILMSRKDFAREIESQGGKESGTALDFQLAEALAQQKKLVSRKRNPN